jgi:hypothetical protein
MLSAGFRNSPAYVIVAVAGWAPQDQERESSTRSRVVGPGVVSVRTAVDAGVREAQLMEGAVSQQLYRCKRTEDRCSFGVEARRPWARHLGWRLCEGVGRELGLSYAAEAQEIRRSWKRALDQAEMRSFVKALLDQVSNREI